jgi:hypothetical protein
MLREGREAVTHCEELVLSIQTQSPVREWRIPIWLARSKVVARVAVVCVIKVIVEELVARCLLFVVAA